MQTSDTMDKERELIDTLDRFEKVLRGSSISNGSSSITVTMQDNKRVTVAMCCAVFSAILFVAILIVGSVLYLDMADHLDAIYMIAPQLQQQGEHHAKP